MAMNFWEAQRKARTLTTIYLTVFIGLTLAIAVLSELTMRYAAGDSYDDSFPYVGVLFLAITFLVAAFQYLMFQSYGGGYVAESMGAQRLGPGNAEGNEKVLLNVVEEVAIAASLPVPRVYVLEADQVNAFAAGLTADRAAICVTRGTLDRLTRDELQGVVAHEFGHIYNGDMKISLRLAAMVMGFFFVLYLSFRLFQIGGLSRGRSSDDRKGNPVVLAALILMLAGVVTYIAGSLLKSMVSRQREYLADASSVQFTRNPDGILGALKKIAKQTASDMPAEGLAYSHLYFDEGSGWTSLFASHPPIEKRIAAIEAKEQEAPEAPETT